MRNKRAETNGIICCYGYLGYDVNSAATLKLIYGDLEAQLNDKPEVKSMIEKLTDLFVN